MKKISMLTFSILLLTLTACASTRSQTGSGTEALSTQMQLAIGTLRLDDTKYPITAEQAKELLPMWYVMQDLNDSDTAAQEEIKGLTNQIKETMTSDQTKAITDMNLTRRDMFTAMQTGNGFSGGTNSTQGNSAFSGGGGGNFQPGGGNFQFGGGGPGGGNQFGGGGTTTSNTTSSQQTRRTVSNKIPSALFDSIIKLLEKKIDE